MKPLKKFLDPVLVGVSRVLGSSESAQHTGVLPMGNRRLHVVTTQHLFTGYFS